MLKSAIALAATIVACAPSICLADSWIIGSDPDAGTVQLALNGFVRSGVIRQIWLEYVVNADKQNFGYFTMKELVEFNCTEHQVRTLKYSTYSAAGTALTDPPGNPAARWDYVVPGTRIESAENFVCSNQTDAEMAKSYVKLWPKTDPETAAINLYKYLQENPIAPTTQ